MEYESDFAVLLRERFNADAADDIDATFAIDWGTGQARFSIRAHALQIDTGPVSPRPDVVIYCNDRDLAYGIFAGSANPIDAFMHGRLRSNGFLSLVFRALRAFSKTV